MARRQGGGRKRVPRTVKRPNYMRPPPPYSPRVKMQPPRSPPPPYSRLPPQTLPPPYSPRVKMESPGQDIPMVADFYDTGDGNLELDLIQSPSPITSSDTVLGIQSAPTVMPRELIDAKRRQHLDPISRELTYARTV